MEMKEKIIEERKKEQLVKYKKIMAQENYIIKR